MSYAASIQSYCQKLMANYGDLLGLPDGYRMADLRLENTSPEAMYGFALGMWNAAMATYRARSGDRKPPKKDDDAVSGDKHLFIKPHVGRYGTYFVDGLTGEMHASLMTQSNGLPSFSGRRSAAVDLGGKGLLSTITTMIGDGDYFHDVGKSKPPSPF